MRKILLALVILSLVAMPAFASVQNIKVSGSIDSSYLTRTNIQAIKTLGYSEEVNQNFFMTQTELKVEADLTDNVSTTVALINERVWDKDKSSTSDTGIDLNLAFVTLKEMLYSPLTVVIGRQAFAYGNSFIFSTGALGVTDSGLSGIADDLSKQTGLDAIRAILDYNPLKLEMFYGKLDSNATAKVGAVSPNSDTDVDVMGIVGAYDFGDAKKSGVEGYVFAKRDKSVKIVGPNVKADSIYVPGIRVSTNLLDSLYTSLEYAHQTGRVGSATSADSLSANAVQFIAVYQLPVAEKYTPVLSYDYTYVSGDKGSGSKKTWNPFFENQNVGKIFNLLYTQSNAHVNTLALQVNPMEDVTTKLSWTCLKLDKKDSSFSSGKKGLGNEIDLDVKYAYTEDVTIGANLGMFMTGSAYKADPEKNQVATQAIVNVNVNF